MNTFQILIWKMASVFGIPVNHWLIFSSTGTISLTECVHPDDLNGFSKNNAFTVFKYVNYGFNYIKIADTKKNIYRVKGNCLYLISNPLADVGDSAIILNGSLAGRIGIIKYLSWHLKDKCFLYRIEIDGTLKKRIYRERDIKVKKSGEHCPLSKFSQSTKNL